MKQVLVTGGAGYVGSHVVRDLLAAGYEVTVIDLLRQSFGTGNRWAVPNGVRLIEGSFFDPQILRRAFSDASERESTFDAVVHLAALILVEESFARPGLYYENNVVGTLKFFEFCLSRGVRSIVFSSSGSVYGSPPEGALPTDCLKLFSETAPLYPMSPYARSKMFGEQILSDLLRLYPESRAMILRYFNPAGASFDLKLGQSRPKATHMVNVAAEAALGRRNRIPVFGTDYPTPDGTCVRDYIHIDDVADVHVRALRALESGEKTATLNIGYGRPYSVLEVIETMSQVSGRELKIERVGRRAGDPAFLAADPSRVKEMLGWIPKYDSLEVICRTQLFWEKARPD